MARIVLETLGNLGDLHPMMLKNLRYSANARRLNDIVYSEDGTFAACDEIEEVFVDRTYA